MLRNTVRVLAVALWLAGTAAHADTLPLPDSLVDLRSAQGEQLLHHPGVLEGFVPLAANFLTQRTQAYCGVASIVVVLNTLGVPAPTSPEYEPYRTFTQDNFLDARTEAVLPREVLAKQGMTLDQIGQLLALHPVEAEVHHAGDGSLDEFRGLAREHVGREGRAVIVNYLRKAINQERGGHISPLAAYDAETDRFLVLDVARYKYPPVWVRADELFAAMNTTDADNQNRTRGYVLIRKAASAARTPAN